MGKHFEDENNFTSLTVLESDMEVLRRCELFEGMPEDLYEKLRKVGVMERINQSTIVMQASEPITDLYVVIEGQFAQYTSESMTTLIRRSAAADVLGVIGIIKHDSGLLFTQAQWASRVYKIAIPILINLMHDYPKLALKAIDLLRDRFFKIGEIGLISEMHTGVTHRNSITGLYNRGWMTTNFERELAELKSSNKAVSIIVMEVNYFQETIKRINRMSSDIMIRQIVDAMVSVLGGELICAHISLERFIILMPDDDTQKAQRLATQLCDAVFKKQVHLPGGLTLQMTMSAIVLNSHQRDLDEVLASALELLQQGQASGGNKVILEVVGSE